MLLSIFRVDQAFGLLLALIRGCGILCFVALSATAEHIDMVLIGFSVK